MQPRLLLTINWKFAVDFFARGLHTRTAVARLPLRQLGFLVFACDKYGGLTGTSFCDAVCVLCLRIVTRLQPDALFSLQ